MWLWEEERRQSQWSGDGRTISTLTQVLLEILDVSLLRATFLFDVDILALLAQAKTIGAQGTGAVTPQLTPAAGGAGHGVCQRRDMYGPFSRVDKIS